MTEDELVEMLGDYRLVKASEEALDMVEEQLANPDVYNGKTLEALTRAANFAAFLKVKSSEMKMKGKKEAAAYLESQVKGLEYVMAALKYKIAGNSR